MLIAIGLLSGAQFAYADIPGPPGAIEMGNGFLILTIAAVVVLLFSLIALRRIKMQSLKDSAEVKNDENATT